MLLFEDTHAAAQFHESPALFYITQMAYSFYSILL